MKKINMKSTPKKRGQSMVEFALALPILLLLIFGIIEFGRLMQAWLALENGARFAMRYAVTGNYDPQYCQEAATALSGVMTAKSILGDDYSATEMINFMTADDDGAGNYDCRVSADYVRNLTGHTGPKEQEEIELLSNVLIDWARLPSIRDVALQGAMGLAYDPNEPVTGDYPAYLDNSYAVNVFDPAHRGNPGQPGYFGITTCSSRTLPYNGGYFAIDSINKEYFDNTEPDTEYPDYCLQYNPDGTKKRFVDDAGGPGDRVRVALTYRHPLITPLLDTWWPTLSLTSQREGIVEKFRTSRVTGLVGAINQAALNTLTPSKTHTPSITPTPTSTETALPTSTAYPCLGGGTILMQKWNIVTSNLNDLRNNAAIYPTNPDENKYPESFNTGQNIGNNYATRFTGWVCPPQDGSYTFYVASDDHSELYLGTTDEMSSRSKIANVNGWTNYQAWGEKDTQKSSPRTLQGGEWYWIETLHREGTGGDHLSVGWTGPFIGETITVIEGQYLKAATPMDTLAPTLTPTKTLVPEKCDFNGSGLMGDYFIQDRNLLSWDVKDYRASRLDPTIDFDWKAGSPFPGIVRNENFQVRWRGWLTPRYAGTYIFRMEVDDGVILTLNGNKIIDKWKDGNTSYESAAIELTCDTIPIKIEYYENIGNAKARLLWRSQYFGNEIIPSIHLEPAEALTAPFATNTFTPTASNTPTPVTPEPTVTTPVPVVTTPVPVVTTPVPVVTTPVPVPTTAVPTIVRTIGGG